MSDLINITQHEEVVHLLNQLINELKEGKENINNIKAMLDITNSKIDKVYGYIKEQESIEQTTKSLITNTIANLVASYIERREILKIKNYYGR